MAGGCLVFLVVYFLWERLRVLKDTGCIPLRICVTGTRGKSSVTRHIAACLRDAGFTVLARSTGAKPLIIYPDGEEKEMRRRGSPSILEGKRLLRLGSELKANALVAELMSIHPECSSVESAQLFSPHILVITNVRLDHLAQMGSSKQEIARCLASAFPENGTVFVLKEECFPVFEKTAERRSARLIQINRDPLEEYPGASDKMLPWEFEENIRLVLALADFLNIDKEVIRKIIETQKPDFGRFKVWSMDVGKPPQSWHLVSCFAVNDPDSTRRVLSRLIEKKFWEAKEVVGLLNLRRDRGDRTIQWLNALEENVFPEFRKVFLIGEHAPAFQRRLKRAANTESFVLRSHLPQRIMEEVPRAVKGEAVLVGLGNMGGPGRELVELWEREGNPCGF